MLVVSLLIAVVFLIGFFWASRNRQFEDDSTPAIRMLFDDEIVKDSKTTHDRKSDIQIRQ